MIFAFAAIMKWINKHNQNGSEKGSVHNACAATADTHGVLIKFGWWNTIGGAVRMRISEICKKRATPKPRPLHPDAQQQRRTKPKPKPFNKPKPLSLS
jgi:hypothetical protein